MRFRVVPELVCTLLLTSILSVQAQTGHELPDPPRPDATATLSTSSTLVAVPALVRTKAGELVYTLAAKDFVLTDNGVPQKLHLEDESGGEPLALVLLVEAGAANRAAGWHPFKPGQAPDRFHGVPSMVEAMASGVPHQIAVVAFDSAPELELDFTESFDDAAKIFHEMTEVDSGDRGAAILDSLVFAVELLRKAPAGYRRAILMLSETDDRGSTSTVGDAVRLLSDTNTAIYSVAFSSAFHEASEYGSKQLPTKAMPLEEIEQRNNPDSRPLTGPELVAARILQGALFGVTLNNPNPGPPTGCMGQDPNISPAEKRNVFSRAYDCAAILLPPLALARMAVIATELHRNVPQAVAKLTGGEYFAFNSAKSLEADLATLANHIPNRYILSFQPHSPAPGPHTIQLTLPDYPGLTVTARTTYWADPVATVPAFGNATR